MGYSPQGHKELDMTEHNDDPNIIVHSFFKKVKSSELNLYPNFLTSFEVPARVSMLLLSRFSRVRLCTTP